MITEQLMNTRVKVSEDLEYSNPKKYLSSIKLFLLYNFYWTPWVRNQKASVLKRTGERDTKKWKVNRRESGLLFLLKHVTKFSTYRIVYFVEGLQQSTCIVY